MAPYEAGPPATAEVIARRVTEALRAACHPSGSVRPSVSVMGALGLLVMSDAASPSRIAAGGAAAVAAGTAFDVDALVTRLFAEEGRALVRLVRLFVDDRNAAEDLVQEGFIRLARSAHRIRDEARAAAYLRSIVLNLARDHNRRGLVSLRHHLPFDDERAATEDEIMLRDDHHEVIEALRQLPHRQRDCLVLRYYEELGIDDVAETLKISRNSVKTHLKRALTAMEERLGAFPPTPGREGGEP